MAEGSSVGKACLFFGIRVPMFAQSTIGYEAHSSDSPPNHDSGNRRNCKRDQRDRSLILIEYPAFETPNHIFMAVTISHGQRKHRIAKGITGTDGPLIQRLSKRQTPNSKKPPRTIFKVCMRVPF